MAGFYETLLQNLNSMPVGSYAPAKTATVFGNAATTPASVDTSNARIDYRQQLVTNAEKTLAAEQAAYDAAMKQYKNQLAAYNNSSNLRWPFGTNIIERLGYNKALQGHQNSASTPTAPSRTALTNAQTALTKAQNDLAKTIANQGLQKIAGQEAVNQGLAAKAAEEQGIANAAKMYQQAMQGEAARNAIMNGAIGTVGNFGGVK